jgi:RimJ/RimL family protein N-acetyltransferase
MLIGKKVILVAPKKEYLPKFVKWMNDPEVLQFLTMYRPITVEEEEKWYQSITNNPKEIHFSILGKIGSENDPKLIGNIGITLDNRNRVGSIGIVIGEKPYWGKGYGTEALQILIEYAFQTLNLHRVELMVYSSNPRAIACYNKVGFKKEGVLRKSVFINGEYHDKIWLGLLKEEWN